MGLNTSKLRAAWKTYECAGKDMVVIPFGPDRIRVAPPTEDAWRALAAVLLQHRYFIRTTDTDSYNCRTITGGSGKSLHAYGIALDINWTTNPFKKTPDKRKVKFSNKATQDERAQDVKRNFADTDMTRAMIDDALAIKTLEGHSLFEWGGFWTNVKDAMHFEIDLSPNDLAVGIDWNTVNGTTDNIEFPINRETARPMTNIPSTAFDIAHPFIAKWEGGFANHPDDPGGATNLGITHKTLSSWRGTPVTVQDVRDLTEEEAKQIFFANYWTPLHGDEMPISLALMTYNAGVNSGPSRSAKLLQQALNELGQDLAVDGEVGVKTLVAANSVEEHSAVESFARAHESFYRGLRTFGVFGRGWLNRLADIRNGALAIVGKTPAPSTGERSMPRPSDPIPPIGQLGDISNITTILSRAAELVRLLEQARAQDTRPGQPAPTNQPISDIGTILQLLLAITGQTGGSPPLIPTPPPVEEPHTPVNNALGQGIGRILNGRKTAIGAIGLLATTLLPVFFPALAPLGSIFSAIGAVADPGTAASAVGGATETATVGTKFMSLLQPLFGIMTGWGVMGKMEKWAPRRS